jgi:hypothetical protein
MLRNRNIISATSHTVSYAMRLMMLMLFTAAGAWAQTASTQILGLITDATGAVVPGATVTARRAETGDVRTTTSNETGNYIFPLVDSGTYEVTCAAPGFKTEIRRNIPLELNQKARVDFQLQVGQQAETVEVTSALPLLKTEDATLGSVVDQRRIIELPLNGRNFAQAATDAGRRLWIRPHGNRWSEYDWDARDAGTDCRPLRQWSARCEPEHYS